VGIAKGQWEATGVSTLSSEMPNGKIKQRTLAE
jgi:hypothetical protein